MPSPTVATLSDFCADPNGKMLLAEHALAWFPSSSFRIFSLWQSPTLHDLACMLKALEASLVTKPVKHTSLVDTRGITFLDSSAIAPYFNALAPKVLEVAEHVRRSAVLVSPGDVAEQIRAYSTLIQFPYEVSIFEDPVACMQWLGQEEQASEIVSLLDAAVASYSRPTGPLLKARQEIRARIERGTGELSVSSVARGLRVSVRSLQRCFEAVGTTFRGEVRKLQVERAIHLLETTDMKLAAVALEVGFQKLHNFNVVFREVTAVSPRIWRLRHTE